MPSYGIYNPKLKCWLNKKGEWSQDIDQIMLFNSIGRAKNSYTQRMIIPYQKALNNKKGCQSLITNMPSHAYIAEVKVEVESFVLALGKNREVINDPKEITLCRLKDEM